MRNTKSSDEFKKKIRKWSPNNSRFDYAKYTHRILVSSIPKHIAKIRYKHLICLNLTTYECIYVYKYTYIWIYEYVYVYICIYGWVYIHMCIIYVDVYMYLCACVCVCMDIWIYIYIHIHTYTYIYVYIICIYNIYI